MPTTFIRVSGLNSDRLELYNFTEFVNFNIKFVGIVVVCHFLDVFLRFTFYVELAVHWMASITDENDMCEHNKFARY